MKIKKEEKENILKCFNGKLTKENFDKIKNPFNVGSRHSTFKLVFKEKYL